MIQVSFLEFCPAVGVPQVHSWVGVVGVVDVVDMVGILGYKKNSVYLLAKNMRNTGDCEIEQSLTCVLRSMVRTLQQIIVPLVHVEHWCVAESIPLTEMQIKRDEPFAHFVFVAVIDFVCAFAFVVDACFKSHLFSARLVDGEFWLIHGVHHANSESPPDALNVLHCSVRKRHCERRKQVETQIVAEAVCRVHVICIVDILCVLSKFFTMHKVT